MVNPAHTLRVVGRSGVLAWRQLPVSELPAEVGRRAKEKAITGRDAFIRSVVTPLTDGNSAQVSYATVLAGNTLNLRATLPAEPPIGADIELVLTGEQRFAMPARIQPGEQPGRPMVTATVALGGPIGGVPITPGAWTLSLLIRGGGTEERLRLAGIGHAPVLSGPTKGLSCCPQTGARYRLGLSATGQLKVVAAPPVPMAEIARVHRSFAGLALDFQPPSGAEQGRLLITDGRQQVEVTHREAAAGDSLLHCTVPLGALIALHQKRRWGFSWVTEQGQKFWLRRRPDDLPAIRSMLTAAGQLVIPDGEGALHYVSQRHTVRGTYQLHFTRVPVPRPREPLTTPRTGTQA